MGSHWTQLKDGQEEMSVGTIVVSTGEIIPLRNSNTTNSNDVEKLPYVESSSERGQKGVYGVWFAKLADNAIDYSFGNPDKPIYQIASLGLFVVRTTDTNGNIHNGDYIQSSPRAGEGEKQDDDLLHSYTIAKSLVDINWDEVPVDPQLGYKWKLIPATLHAG